MIYLQIVLSFPYEVNAFQNRSSKNITTNKNYLVWFKTEPTEPDRVIILF